MISSNREYALMNGRFLLFYFKLLGKRAVSIGSFKN
ncbi:Uncharacterised protein [Listeria fleischmannii subsp. fleischmannii]|uniref:Uncharacterized protein n=1 Tax=Listeria fleischmannii subsp. fleischmannii TaxID=1671902 RepID=A0A2X3GLU1_9LIST|nr:Uncharacterised protein [Listeria fleischmannii subsp. fleischmannii]